MDPASPASDFGVAPAIVSAAAAAASPSAVGINAGLLALGKVLRPEGDP